MCHQTMTVVKNQTKITFAPFYFLFFNSFLPHKWSYHMTRTAPCAISLESHKIKGPVPYEGCALQSDRAGKTRMAPLEMRTALLEMRLAQSMWVNDVNAKFFFLQCEYIMKVNILTVNFTIMANCPMQNYFSRQLTPKARKESQHSFVFDFLFWKSSHTIHNYNKLVTIQYLQ